MDGRGGLGGGRGAGGGGGAIQGVVPLGSAVCRHAKRTVARGVMGTAGGTKEGRGVMGVWREAGGEEHLVL